MGKNEMPRDRDVYNAANSVLVMGGVNDEELGVDCTAFADQDPTKHSTSC